MSTKPPTSPRNRDSEIGNRKSPSGSQFEIRNPQSSPSRTSQKQLEANRRNALKSTGPRTPAGKARASRNALRHGFRAQSALILSDDPDHRAELDYYLTSLHQDLKPRSEHESQLVSQIALCFWQLDRAVRFEAQATEKARALCTARIAARQSAIGNRQSKINSQSAIPDPQYSVALSDSPDLERLVRYESRIDTQLNRAMNELFRSRKGPGRMLRADRTHCAGLARESVLVPGIPGTLSRKLATCVPHNLQAASSCVLPDSADLELLVRYESRGDRTNPKEPAIPAPPPPASEREANSSPDVEAKLAASCVLPNLVEASAPNEPNFPAARSSRSSSHAKAQRRQGYVLQSVVCAGPEPGRGAPWRELISVHSGEDSSLRTTTNHSRARDVIIRPIRAPPAESSTPDWGSRPATRDLRRGTGLVASH